MVTLSVFNLFMQHEVGKKKDGVSNNERTKEGSKAIEVVPRHLGRFNESRVGHHIKYE